MPICLSLTLLCLISQIFYILLSLNYTNGAKLSFEKSELLVFSVKENSPVNAIVGRISIAGFLPPFEIHESDGKNIRIDRETGIIRVMEHIDREIRAVYSFLIISSNGDTKSLKVNIEDVNDNTPKFNTTSLEKIIPENYPIGSKVDLTSVFDPDDGHNSIENIAIVSGDSDDHFSVDYYNGGNGYFYLRLVLMRQLDYETSTQYNMLVQATDGGSPRLSGTLFLKIIIENANDNAPKFDLSRYVALVREDQIPNETIIAQVRATDKDVGLAGQLTYFIDSNNNNYADSNFVAINSLTGDVSLRASLDYELKRQLTLSVAVRDNVVPFHTSRASLIVDVIDVNDNPPSVQINFPEQRNEVHVNTEPNSLVAHINVIDLDSVSTHFFVKILNADCPLKIEKVLPKMWELRTTERLNSFTKNNITVILEVVDSPPPSLKSSTVVTINIKHSEVTKYKLSKTVYIVHLDVPVSRANENITTISLSDHVSSEMAGTYFSITDDGGQLFHIDRNTGQISSTKAIDCGQYNIGVSLHSKNSATLLDKAQIKVIIKGNRKSSLYFVSGFRRVVLEGSVATNVQCTSDILVANRHCNREVKYKMAPLMKVRGSSMSITESGDICTDRNNVTPMVHQRHFYKIIATEKNSAEASTNALFIQTTSVSELRTISKQISVTYSSARNTSIPVARVMATFRNEPPYLYYGLIQYTFGSHGALPISLYRLDQVTGEIYISSSAVPRTRDETLEIMPSVNGQPIVSQSVSIVLSSTSTKQFTKSLYEFLITLLHNPPSETFVGQVSLSASSMSGDHPVTYQLVQSTYREVIFNIDAHTGSIRARNLHLLSNVVSINVVARWKNSGQCFAQVLVMLDRGSDSPSFVSTSLEVNIWENATIGTELVQMIPNKSSWSDDYSICYGRYSDWFSIHPKSGQVFLQRKLDKEEVSRAIITVELRNKYGNVKINVNINILDNNDHPPTCKESSVNITLDDSTRIGLVTCPIRCSDIDTIDNGNLTYHGKILAPNGIDSPLRVIELTGCIEVSSSLDNWPRNPSGELVYSVTVSDNGRDGAMYTSVTVHIKIINTNNHKPFVKSYDVFHVQESAAPGTEIGKLVLDDYDPGDIVSVYVNHRRYGKSFYIESLSANTAILRSRYIKDITPGYHQVPLKLVDSAFPPNLSFMNVTIIVDDSNDHDPEIIYPQVNEKVSYSCLLLPGSEILRVKARDLDRGVNSRLDYYIKDKEIKQDVFSMDKRTGVLTTRLVSSCAQVTRLEILVYDTGYPRRSSSVTIFLTPKKHQDQMQALFRQNLTFVMPPNAKPGTRIGILRIKEWEDLLGVKYLFDGSSPVSPDSLIHIDYESQRIVLLQRPLIQQSLHQYSIVAVCHKAIIPPRIFQFTLHLQSDIVHTNWPALTTDITIIKVKENQPPGTRLKQFNPSSKSPYNAVLYSLRQPSDYFVIDPITGVLVTFVSLDREQMPYDEVPIEIIATSAVDPSKFVVLPVQIIVEDVNDNAPIIISPVNCTLQVSAFDSSNASIARVVALDRDKNENGLFNYTIENNALFTIDARTGNIWLTSAPMRQHYEVNVTVTDCGQPSLASWRVLTFQFQQNEMDNKIRFATKTMSMNLSLTNGQRLSTLGRATLANRDSNPAVKFLLMAGNYSHLFMIDPDLGDIRPSIHISGADIGTTETLKLSVVAYLIGDSSNYDIAQLLIHIDYGNTHAPVFAKLKYFVKLPEGEAITDFLTVGAHDRDLGVYGLVTYHLLGDVVDGRISIDSSTGTLSCRALHYVERKTYNLEVIATDSLGGPLSKNKSAFVQVDVQNSLQKPLEFNSSHFTVNVRENMPRGTVLGHLTVQSKPLDATILYLLNPGHALIDIDSSNGRLMTNGPIDRETLAFIEVTIYATYVNANSQIFQSTKATVTIKIIDENDNAPMPTQNPVIVFIPNTDKVSTPLARLSATDPDAYSDISFHFDLADFITSNLTSQYHLDPSSGILKYRFSALKPGFSRHFLRIIISDNGSPQRTTKVLVVITIQRPSSLLNITPEKAIFRLHENPSMGMFIGQIYITGNCSSGRVSVSIIDGINKDLVYMHAATGKLFVSSTNTIDREQIKEIVLWTQALCLGTDLIGFKQVVIMIEDVDDNKPMFSQKQYEAFLLEGQPPKTSVIRAIIYDSDEGINNQVEFFIEMYLDEFSIDSDGTVRTNIPLNFHTKSLYSLTIKGSSKSTPLSFAECRLTVHIINVNDQRPIFSSAIHNLHIFEDRPVGSLITTITATDSDGPDRISYRIRPRAMTNYARFLSIAYDSGEVFLSRKLSNKDIGRHEVDIVADDSKYSSSTILSIDVTDINNEYPILLEDGHHYLVTESLGVGSIIGYLHASDRDTGVNGEVAFDLLPRVPWLDLREFHNNTAALYLTSQPQFVTKVFFLGIQLKDKATDPNRRLLSISSVALIAETSNSHPPQFFNRSPVILNISESAVIGTKITTLHCKDPDDHVTYWINSSTFVSPLYIETESGDVFLIESLLNYPRQRFTETVICQDIGKPQRSTTLLLTISIDRIVQRPPLLVEYMDNVTIELFEASHYPVFVKHLWNTVQGRGSAVTYSVACAIPSRVVTDTESRVVFHVDIRGNLWLNSSTGSDPWIILFRKTNQPVMEKTLPDLYHTTYGRLMVTISAGTTSRDDNCVHINRLTAVIKENESPATTVLNLPMWYNDIRFSMAEDEHLVLSCIEYPVTNCRVVSKTSLDFERVERFELTISVTGTTTANSQSCSNSFLLVVNVLDVDEFYPVFTQSEYSYSVPGGVPDLGKVLFTVTATDNDKGRFGLIYYRLESAHNGYFDIRNDSGDIFFKTSFPAVNNSRSRKKRLNEDLEQTGFHRKTFSINVIASSGEKMASVIVRLTILVPLLPEDSSYRIILTKLQTSLIIGLLVAVVVIIVIIAAVLLMWRAKCFRRHRPRDIPGSLPESDGSRRYQSTICRTCDKHSDHEYEDPRIAFSGLYDASFPPYNEKHPDLITGMLGKYDLNDLSGNHSDELCPMQMRIHGSSPSDPSSSQIGIRTNNFYIDNYNNKQILSYKGHRNETRSHDSDQSGTSSSCYSSLNLRCIPPNMYVPVSQLNWSDTSQRSIDRPNDYTVGTHHRPTRHKKKSTQSSVELKPRERFQESIQLDVMNQNGDFRHSADQSTYPLLRGSGSDGQKIKVLSVDVPQDGVIYSHSQSSSNHHDTSNAQTYSDITSIDS